MKKIFIITSYYPPEIGAAANRIKHMAEGLQVLGYDVTVITPLPNYPTGKIFTEYRGRFISKSVQDGVHIVRLWIYASNSKNKLRRMLSMVSYSFSLIIYYALHKIPDLVVVQSPPLLVALTSMITLKSKKRKLVLNVSDLWPLAGVELGALKSGAVLNLLKRVERFNYKSADLILGQSNEIIQHVTHLFPKKKTFLYRNFPVIHNYPERIEPTQSTPIITLVYAGLLGIAQGVLEICKNLDFSRIELHIYGDGAERYGLEKFISENGNLPIMYHGNISRSVLHQEIVKYDFALIPLKNRIYGSVPSKIYEYASVGLPSIYFGGGEGENVVKQKRLGVVVESGNFSELNRVLSKIDTTEFDISFREQLIITANLHFNLSKQIKELSAHL